ncbi:Heat shock factor binding 1 like protein, partial [Aduncisulcus paluster]
MSDPKFSPTTAEDLSKFIQTLLTDVGRKFEDMSKNVTEKITEL